MKTKQEIIQESEAYKKQIAIERDLQELQELEEELCKGRRYYGEGGISQKKIDYLLNLGFNVHKRKEAIGYGIWIIDDGNGQFIDDKPAYEAKRQEKERIKKNRPWWKKIFDEKPILHY